MSFDEQPIEDEIVREYKTERRAMIMELNETIAERDKLRDVIRLLSGPVRRVHEYIVSHATLATCPTAINQWQSCDKCGRMQRFEFSVTHELWARSGCLAEGEILCIECWCEKLETSGVTTITLDDFRFIGIVCQNEAVGGILMDRVPQAGETRT